MLIFYSFKASGSTFSRLHQRLLKSLKDEVLDTPEARDFNVTSLSTYDFFTLYTTLTHNLIKE